MQNDFEKLADHCQHHQRISKKVLDNFLMNYMDKVELRSLDKPEREFLEFQASHPWRYCFAHITDHPAKDFFSLRDAFFGDEFLLYSPGTEAYWAEGRKPAAAPSTRCGSTNWLWTGKHRSRQPSRYKGSEESGILISNPSPSFHPLIWNNFFF
jgi:hypothetical protein